MTLYTCTPSLHGVRSQAHVFVHPPASSPQQLARVHLLVMQDDLTSNEYVLKKAELRYMKIMHMRARGRWVHRG